MSRLLLTGTTGFIGRHVVPRLLADGHSVTVLALELDQAIALHGPEVACHAVPRDVAGLSDLLAAERPDAVLHLASLFLAAHTPEQVGPLVSSNILFPALLLEAMKSTGVRRFLNVGTFWQYPVSETYEPVNLYAATKQAFETLLAHYTQSEGFSAVTLRLADTYGQGDMRRKILQILVEAGLKDEPLGLSPGEQKISLTHVEDVAAAFSRGVGLLGELEPGDSRVYYACDPALRSLKEIARDVEAALRRPLRLEWGARPYRPREVMLPRIGMVLPGWSPTVPLDQGIASLVQAYRERQ